MEKCSHFLSRWPGTAVKGAPIMCPGVPGVWLRLSEGHLPQWPLKTQPKKKGPTSDITKPHFKLTLPQLSHQQLATKRQPATSHQQPASTAFTSKVRPNPPPSASKPAVTSSFSTTIPSQIPRINTTTSILIAFQGRSPSICSPLNFIYLWVQHFLHVAISSTSRPS